MQLVAVANRETNRRSALGNTSPSDGSRYDRRVLFVLMSAATREHYLHVMAESDVRCVCYHQ